MSALPHQQRTVQKDSQKRRASRKVSVTRAMCITIYTSGCNDTELVSVLTVVLNGIVTKLLTGGQLQ
jgi:hypothetical protein